MDPIFNQTQDYNPLTGDVQLNPAAWGLSMADINSAATVSLRSSIYAGNVNLTADQYREIRELVQNKYSGVDYTGMIKGSGMLSDIPMLGRDPGLYMNQERLGYWKNDADQWQAYIANNGNFAFQGDANNYISWNGSELVIRGSIFLEDGTSITDMNNTFYQDTAPTVFTDGDIWFDTNDGNKMYLSVLGVWTSVQDALAPQAISDAATAQATADGKATVYYQTTAPVLTASDVGDLWVDTDAGNRVATWNGTAWVSVSNADAINALAAASTAQSTADGKIDSFYQDTAPVVFSEGDIWFDTNDGNKIYTARSGIWVATQDSLIAQAINDAQTAQTTADGKAGVYYQASAPVLTASDVGDLWVDTDSGNRVATWNGTTWVSVSNADAIQALADAATAQSTADGKIESFYQTTAPGTASEGDIWFDTDDGNKIYTRRSGVWVATQDSLIAQAINDAQTAQTTADGKARVYYQTSAPTLGAGDVGDLWVDTDDNNKVTTWTGSAWIATSNTDAITALANAATAQATADGKIESFYQTTAPAVFSEGDIWFDTDDGNKIYTARSGIWVATQDSLIATAINDAQTAQTTADGKAKVYYQTTAPTLTAGDVGDLWVDTDDNNKVTTWNGTAWVSTSNTDAIAALAAAATAQATADGKIDTYYQTTAPGSASEGDIWFDTDDGNKMYTYRSTVWTNTQDTAIGDAITAAAGAQSTADGKVTTFYLPTSTPPTAEGVGDLWYNTTTNIITRWSGSAWQDIRDIGATKADTALDSSSRYTKWLESNLISETKVKTGYTGVILDNEGIGGYTAGVATFRVDRLTGNAFFSGEITAGGLDVGTAGNIRGGQATYNAATAGFFLGYSGGAYKFSIGDGTGTKGLTWNGSDLSINGAITSSSGVIGGWTLGSTSLSAVSGGNTVSISSGSTAFSAGPTGSPTVTITQAGVFTAIGGTITGALLRTAASGERIEMTGTSLRNYDSSGTLRTSVAGGFISLYGVNFGELGTIYENSTGMIFTADTAVFEFGGEIKITGSGGGFFAESSTPKWKLGADKGSIPYRDTTAILTTGGTANRQIPLMIDGTLYYVQAAV